VAFPRHSRWCIDRYIKCIITRDCTLILDVDQVAVKAFVQQLQLKVTEKMDHGEEGGLEQAPPGGNPHLQVPVTQVPHELRVLEAALDNVRPPPPPPHCFSTFNDISKLSWGVSQGRVFLQAFVEVSSMDDAGTWASGWGVHD